MEPILLYIDPHPATRLLVEKVLAAEAFVVHQAHTGVDGQQSAAHLRPDLVLVDVDRVRAPELISALRRLPGLEHVRLLASTADARPEYLEKMLAWGFDRVWLQPLDIDTLACDLRLALPSRPPAEPSGEVPAATAAPVAAGWLEPRTAESRNGIEVEAALPAVGEVARISSEAGPVDGGASLRAGEADASDGDTIDLGGEAHGLDNGLVGVVGEAPVAENGLVELGEETHGLEGGLAGVVGEAPDTENGLVELGGQAHGLDSGLAGVVGEAPDAENGLVELGGEAHGLDNGLAGDVGEAPDTENGLVEFGGQAHGLDSGLAGVVGEAPSAENGLGAFGDEPHGLDSGLAGVVGEAPGAENGLGEFGGEPHDLDSGLAGVAGEAPDTENGLLGLDGEAPGLDSGVVELVGEAHGADNGLTLEALARDAEPPVLPLEPAEVSALWRLSLTPLMAQLARSTASADGVLALLDQEARSLVVVATVGSRYGDNGGGGMGGPVVGARVLSRAVPWIHPALHGREVVAVAAETIAPGPLAPPGRPALLIVPVASRERVRGVAILSKHRGAKEPAFAPGKVARSLAQAQQIAGVVEMLEALDRAAAQRRQEMEDLRRQSVRAVLSEVAALARPPRRNGASGETAHASNGEGSGRDLVIGLGLRVADRLGLPARKREVLRQALEVRDVGRAWVEHVLFARATFSAAARERLLGRATEHGAQILSALDWPPAVVELVRIHQAQRNGEGPLPGPGGGDVPIEARIMAVMSAYGALVAGRGGDADAAREALAELARQGHDPAVVDALMGLALARGASELEPR